MGKNVDYWEGRAYCLLHDYDQTCISQSRKGVEYAIKEMRLRENCDCPRKKIRTYRAGGLFTGDAVVEMDGVLADVQIKSLKNVPGYN